MKKKRGILFFKTVFFILYLGLLSAGVFASRMFALPDAITPSADEAWKAGVEALLPSHDNPALKDGFSLEEREIFPAFQIKTHEDDDGQLLEFFDLKGFVFRVEGQSPYGGYSLLVGLNADGRITGVDLLQQREPRGVGQAVEASDSFWESFRDKGPEELSLLMDGGKIVPVLGAVEVSRRYTECVKQAAENYLANKELWDKKAMGERRSFDDLKKLEDAENQPPDGTEEEKHETFFPRVF